MTNPGTRRLPYTPDMFPDVPQYEGKPPRRAWWWVVVVGGIALLVAALAVAVVLWVRSSNPVVDPQPQPQGQPAGPPRVTDAASKLSYLHPDGWKKQGGLAQPFTSGLGKDGGFVVAFPHEGPVEPLTPEQLQAQARSIAFKNAEFFMPQPGTREALSTRSLRIGGRDAASASFRLAFSTEDPAYVRVVLVPTGDGTMSYLYGSVKPDGAAARQALDRILDSVTPVSSP